MSADTVHVSVRIDRPYREVYTFVSDPRNMRRWAAGLADGLEEDPEDGDWVGKGPDGSKRVRFVPRNRFGVVDHDVSLEDGTVVHVPLRVLRTAAGSEVVLTLFRLPKMTDAQLASDKAAVERDLGKLKKLLESGDVPRTEALEHLRFPNESDGYRTARNALLESEMDLRRQVEAVAAERRRLPPGGLLAHDYELERLSPEGKPERVTLSELFSEGKDTLVVYSMMYGPDAEPCPGCTHFLDGLDGAVRSARHYIDVLVVAKSPIQRIVELGRARGWRYLPLASVAGTSYSRDYFGDTSSVGAAMRKQQQFPDGEQWDMPMINVFQRTAEGVRHTYASELLYVPSEPGQDYRHNDQLDPMWNLLDYTPGGREGREPKVEF